MTLFVNVIDHILFTIFEKILKIFVISFFERKLILRVAFERYLRNHPELRSIPVK